MENKIPLKPGYYWAKWRIASDDTPEMEDYTPSDRWEIVEVDVNDHHADSPAEPEALSVSVCGVQTTQWRDCFVWGDFVAPIERTSMVADHLTDLAEDAQKVLWWAFRMRMPKEQQLVETVKAFEVRLGYRAAITQSNGD